MRVRYFVSSLSLSLSLSSAPVPPPSLPLRTHRPAWPSGCPLQESSLVEGFLLERTVLPAPLRQAGQVRDARALLFVEPMDMPEIQAVGQDGLPVKATFRETHSASSSSSSSSPLPSLEEIEEKYLQFAAEVSFPLIPPSFFR